MLIYFILSCVALAISPGPDNIYMAALTSRSGKIAGFSFLMGLISGCFIHSILLAFGLNELLIRHYIFFEISKIYPAIVDDSISGGSKSKLLYKSLIFFSPLIITFP